MTIVKYRRRHPMMSMAEDMNQLFNTMWSRPVISTSSEHRWVPAFDIRETDENIVFEAALPGIDKKNIDVTVNEGVLTIEGVRNERELNENERIHTAELFSGKFRRAFTLPSNVDEEKVDAKYKDGILTLTVKKLTPVEPERKQITIK